jgi:iron complex outermembrane receptor protein
MKYILSLLLGSIAGALSAQGSLSGKVTAEGLPLASVSVYAPDIQKGTTTDADGHYTLKNLPLGQLKITFTFTGYQIENREMAISGDSHLDVALEENIHQMDEVIVSTPFNKLQSQNVMKVEHAGIKALEQKGAATLIDALSTIPGVSQVSTGTSIGKPVIRGLTGNRVLVYSQGVRLENQQFGDEHGLGLNDSGVESVEVIKGPASLLYGSDALGGVLYFNPEKFADAHEFKTDISQKLFANTLGSETSFGAKTSSGNWKFLVRGAYDTHADYKVPDGDRVTNSRYDESDLKTGIGYSKSNFSSVLRYNFNLLNLGIPENGISEQTTSHNPDFPRQKVYNHIVSLHNSLFLERATLEADFGYIANDRSEFEDSDTPSLRMKLHTLNYDLKYHFPKWGNWETIAGAQGMYQTNANLADEFLIPDATVFDSGIFATGNYSWNNQGFQAGLRYDNRKLDAKTHGNAGEAGYFAPVGRSFDSFNAALGYKADLPGNFSVRLNVASGFRAPNLAELTSNGVHEGANRFEIGNASLENEQNIQTDLNLEWKNNHVEVFVNGFYNHIGHYIYAAPSGETIDGFNVYRYVQNNATLYGGEAGIHFHPHPLDWLHIESNFSSVTGKRSDGEYLPLIPANVWTNTVRAEFSYKSWLKNGFARLDLPFTFAQNNVGGFETASKDYTLVNAGVGGKLVFGKMAFHFSLNGNNLLDKSYIAHLSRLKPDGIPNIGRNFMLNFSADL